MPRGRSKRGESSVKSVMHPAVALQATGRRRSRRCCQHTSMPSHACLADDWVGFQVGGAEASDLCLGDATLLHKPSGRADSGMKAMHCLARSAPLHSKPHARGPRRCTVDSSSAICHMPCTARCCCTVAPGGRYNTCTCLGQEVSRPQNLCHSLVAGEASGHGNVVCRVCGQGAWGAAHAWGMWERHSRRLWVACAGTACLSSWSAEWVPRVHARHARHAHVLRSRSHHRTVSWPARSLQGGSKFVTHQSRLLAAPFDGSLERLQPRQQCTCVLRSKQASGHCPRGPPPHRCRQPAQAGACEAANRRAVRREGWPHTGQAAAKCHTACRG